MNESKLKKIILSLFITAICVSSVFSLPGVKSYIPDSSGEYVYYKDKSFNRTSYIGFLFYDESTYAVRYFAPEDTKKSLLEKNIVLYFSVNPNNPQLEFTGEKITGVIKEEDAEIVNYLHDIFYEFVSRRQKLLADISKENVVQTQDFNQFGGDVKIKFNRYVPIFNIESISAIDNTPLFSVETIGLLTSSDDTSFANYSGVEGLPKDKKKNPKKYGKAKKIEYTFEGQKLALDEEWKQSMENLWLLGDDAVLTVTEFEFPENKTEINKEIFIRKLIQGTTMSYALWNFKSIVEKDNKVTVMNVYFQPETENVTRDYKILIFSGKGKVSLLSLTIFDSVYQKNKKYFDSILLNYKLEK